MAVSAVAAAEDDPADTGVAGVAPAAPVVAIVCLVDRVTEGAKVAFIHLAKEREVDVSLRLFCISVICFHQ